MKYKEMIERIKKEFEGAGYALTFDTLKTRTYIHVWDRKTHRDCTFEVHRVESNGEEEGYGFSPFDVPFQTMEQLDRAIETAYMLLK